MASPRVDGSSALSWEGVGGKWLKRQDVKPDAIYKQTAEKAKSGLLQTITSKITGRELIPVATAESGEVAYVKIATLSKQLGLSKAEVKELKETKNDARLHKVSELVIRQEMRAILASGNGIKVDTTASMAPRLARVFIEAKASGHDIEKVIGSSGLTDVEKKFALDMFNVVKHSQNPLELTKQIISHPNSSRHMVALLAEVYKDAVTRGDDDSLRKIADTALRAGVKDMFEFYKSTLRTLDLDSSKKAAVLSLVVPMLNGDEKSVLKVLEASHHPEQNLEDAKEYIASHSLTSDHLEKMENSAAQHVQKLLEARGH